MHLSLVISSLAAGGAEHVMCTLANHWSGQGHEVTIFTTHDGGGSPHYRLDASVRLESVDPRCANVARQVRVVAGLRREFRHGGADAIVSFLNYTNILTLAAARNLDVPVIISERLDPRVIGIGPAWSALRRLTYPRATRLVAQTATAARLYEKFTPGRVVVIPNPVAPFPAAVGPRPAEMPRGPLVIAVGRLQPQKGYDVALRALALLPPAFDEWKLLILGEGPLRGEIEALRNQLGLESRVLMPGRVPDPNPWLAGADIFLMSSRSEGFPNALCEAMAAGLPVVCTDCPSGPAEIIDPDINGLLVPSGAPRAMSEALASLMGSRERRQELAAAAPGIVERFSEATVLDQWDRLVLSVANRSTGATSGRTVRSTGS